MSINTLKTVGALIEELKKYPADTQIVAGNGANGYLNLYVSTVKDQIVEEYLTRYCENWGVTPNTVTISEYY